MLNYHQVQEHIQGFFAAIGANAGADYDLIELLNEGVALQQEHEGDIQTPQPHHSSTQEEVTPSPKEEGTLKH